MFESLFAGIFLLELVLRVLCQGLSYFKQPFNVVDAGLVILGVVETWILTFTSGCSHSGSVKVLLTLRILRILRVIRFFKLVKSFEQLRLIISGVVNAMKTVLWVIVLLILLLYMCAIFTTTQIGTSPYFSTIPESMVSLWQIATLDNWAEAIVRPITEQSPLLLLLFLPFIFVTTYGLFNVILGIVVEATVESSAVKSEQARRENEIERQTALDSIAHILQCCDSNNTGVITELEFQEICKLDEIEFKLEKILKLEKSDISQIFESLADSEGNILISELLSAISQMTAPASSFQRDIGQVLLTMEGLATRLSAVEDQIRSVDRQIDHLCFKGDQFAKSTLYFLTGSNRSS